MNTFHGVRRSVSLHLPLESQHVAERGAADVKRKGEKKTPLPNTLRADLFKTEFRVVKRIC